MDIDSPPSTALGTAPVVTGVAGQGRCAVESAAAAVTALYQAHALGLVRLAYVMLADKAAAEDVVQDAFSGLYQRWDRLSRPEKALPYVRSSVLNGCRSVLRRKLPGDTREADQAFAISAEAAALAGEERREVMRLLRHLPDRQREVLVLRFYLGLSDAEIARDMGIRQGTVRSTAHRALAAIGRALLEAS